METSNWKEYISGLLTKSGQFELKETETVNQTDKEYYRSTLANNKSTFVVGYVLDSLMYMNLENEDVPGYTKYAGGEYFFDSDFDHSRQPRTGLTFDEINCKGIRKELESGLLGSEEQYLDGDKVIYSKLFLHNEHFSIKYDFTGRGFWQRLFGPKVPNKANTTFRTIDLKKIFSGI